MIGVMRFVVGSTVNAAGEMMSLAFRTMDGMRDMACTALGVTRNAADKATGQARDFANHSSQYADDAADATEAWANDVADSAGDAVETVSEVAESLVDDDADRRPYEERTRAELYELAIERDISGRSTMNKEELIAALRAERS